MELKFRGKYLNLFPRTDKNVSFYLYHQEPMNIKSMTLLNFNRLVFVAVSKSFGQLLLAPQEQLDRETSCITTEP